MPMGFEFYVIGAYLDCVGCSSYHDYECHTDCCMKCESRSFRLTVKEDGSYDLNFCCIWDAVNPPRPGRTCEHYLETGWR